MCFRVSRKNPKYIKKRCAKMLTIKSSGYSITDLEKLKEILISGYNKVITDCPKTCAICENFRICHDVTESIKFLDEKIKIKS